MSLIECSECKGKVSDKAVSCPHCGMPLSNNNYQNQSIKKKKKFTDWALIIGVPVASVLFLIFGFTFKETLQRNKAENGSGQSVSSNVIEQSKAVEIKNIDPEAIEEVPTPITKPKTRTNSLVETLDELGSEKGKLDYLFNKLQKAADDRDLLPVDRKNSATSYLIEMLKVNRHHHMISQGRAYIAQMHLEAAREARTVGKWDDAQDHLDAALEVRLPDSYLPNDSSQTFGKTDQNYISSGKARTYTSSKDPACYGKDQSACDALSAILNLKGKACYSMLSAVNLNGNTYQVRCQKYSRSKEEETYTFTL